ncbi:hypothetical protein N7U49_07215 [Streptomyces sp. AD2-2]|nr:hypothetical protein N7U49_07215 [Streptomyces sp. AD2-2]
MHQPAVLLGGPAERLAEQARVQQDEYLLGELPIGPGRPRQCSGVGPMRSWSKRCPLTTQ